MILRSPSRNTCIVEFAGLPGSGKTVISDLLLERLGAGHLSWTKSYSQQLRRMYIDRLFLPLTAARFHRVFRELYQNKETYERTPFLLWVTGLIFHVAVSSRVNLKGCNSAPTSIFFLLNELMVEYCLAVVEASFYRKIVILDEGFVQRGVGVWLRAPSEVRADLWSTYLSCIPKGVLCFVLNCEPAEASRRAELRPRGLRAVLRWAPCSSPNRNWLTEQYEQMSELLMSQALTTYVKCVHVNAETTPEELADVILGKLEAIRLLKDLAIFARN